MDKNKCPFLGIPFISWKKQKKLSQSINFPRIFKMRVSPTKKYSTAVFFTSYESIQSCNIIRPPPRINIFCKYKNVKQTKKKIKEKKIKEKKNKEKKIKEKKLNLQL